MKIRKLGKNATSIEVTRTTSTVLACTKCELSGSTHWNNVMVLILKGMV